jgi:hypothetical protein
MRSIAESVLDEVLAAIDDDQLKRLIEEVFWAGYQEGVLDAKSTAKESQ